MATFTAIVSHTDVRAFIEEYFKAWEGTDENRVLSCCAETLSLQVPGTVINGKAALRDQFVRPFVAGVPGSRLLSLRSLGGSFVHFHFERIFS